MCCWIITASELVGLADINTKIDCLLEFPSSHLLHVVELFSLQLNAFVPFVIIDSSQAISEVV